MHPELSIVFDNTKCMVGVVVVWEISMWQTKQIDTINYLHYIILDRLV
jgi:hypothetical protein